MLGFVTVKVCVPVDTLIVVPDTLPATYGLDWYKEAILVPPTCRAVVALIVGAAMVPDAVMFAAVAVPVKAGDANGASKFSAFWVAVDIGLLASEVLLTLPRPTIAAVMPLTVPVKVGLASGANKFNAVWVAVDIGLLASEVLLTLPRPTMAAVMPLTVPVNVGLSFFAYEPRVVARLDEVM